MVFLRIGRTGVRKRLGPAGSWLAVVVGTALVGTGIRWSIVTATAPPSSDTRSSPTVTVPAVAAVSGPLDVTGGYATAAPDASGGGWSMSLPKGTSLPAFPADTTCEDMYPALRRLGGADEAVTRIRVTTRVRRPIRELTVDSVRAQVLRPLPFTNALRVECRSRPEDREQLRLSPFAGDAMNDGLPMLDLDDSLEGVPIVLPHEEMDFGVALLGYEPQYGKGDLNSGSIIVGAYQAGYEWELLLRFRVDGRMFGYTLRDNGRPFVTTHGVFKDPKADGVLLWCEGPDAHFRAVAPGEPGSECPA